MNAQAAAVGGAMSIRSARKIVAPLMGAALLFSFSSGHVLANTTCYTVSTETGGHRRICSGTGGNLFEFDCRGGFFGGQNWLAPRCSACGLCHRDEKARGTFDQGRHMPEFRKRTAAVPAAGFAWSAGTRLRRKDGRLCMVDPKGVELLCFAEGSMVLRDDKGQAALVFSPKRATIRSPRLISR